MKRPAVGVALVWVLGVFIVYDDERLWLLLPLMLAMVLSLVCPHVFRMSRKMAVWLIIIFIISVAYNLWFDSRNVSSLRAGLEDSVSEIELTLQGTIVTPIDVNGDQASFVLKVGQGERLQVFIRLATQREHEAVTVWQRGDVAVLTGVLQQPEAARNFDSFEYGDFLYFQRIHWIMQVTGLGGVVVKKPSSLQLNHLYRWTDSIRQALGDKVDRVFSASYGGFMKSLLIGLRDDLQPEQFQQFSLIGLTHIMAISGLHVAVFISGCMVVMKAIGLTRETMLLVMIYVIPFYIILTGAAPSVVRAGCMAIIGLYALRRRRLKDGLNIISIVGTGMLIINPYYFFQISFQLSFIVTLGLIIMVPIFNKLIPLRSQLIKSSISVTLAAQLCSFPLSIYYFNHYSLLSWLANLVLVPLISVVVIPMGMVTLLISLISERLAALLAFCINALNVSVFYSVEQLNQFRIFQLIWASPSMLWIILFYLFLAIVLKCLSINVPFKDNKVRRVLFYVTTSALCLLLLVGYHPDYFNRSGLVQLIDVGQGDAILIRTPEGKVVLIDGGGTMRFRKEGDEWKNRRDPYEVGKNLVVPLLKKRGIHYVDYLILTHADHDHYGGLQAVIENIPIRALIFNGTLKKAETYETFLKTALDLNIPIYAASEGREIQVDKITTMTFLYPVEAQRLQHIPKQNTMSLVGLIDMYDFRFLFTGDMEVRAERDILSRLNDELDRPIDVLKVAHHGSKTSTSDQWLAYWKPKLALIPVGRYNTFGHPHPLVIERLENFKISVYRSDLHGEIQIDVKEDSLRLRTKLNHN